MPPYDGPHRKTNRWSGHGYADRQACFVTVCTHGRETLLATVTTGGMADTPAGHAVRREWDALPTRFAGVTTEALVVMPDHVHGIVAIDRDDGAVSLIRVMNAFKSLSARDVNRTLGRSGVGVWQRSFYDRVIRDDDEYERIAAYIVDNPRRWIERHRKVDANRDVSLM